MAHPARGPAVPRTAVSLHKHSTGHGRPSTPGSGLPAHAPQPRRDCGGQAQALRLTPLSMAGGAAHRWRHAVAGGSGSRTSGRPGVPVCAAARGPVSAAADTPSPPDCPHALLGCQAAFRPPVGAATRSNSRCALPHLVAPQGAAKEGTGAAALWPVQRLPVTPPSPHGDAADRVDSCGAVWCTVPRG
jgi:hypothetical protein